MNRENDDERRTPSPETILTHEGREPGEHFGFVNTPVFRGSTVLFKTLADLDAQEQRFLYGRAGNPTTRSVETIITALEEAHDTVLVPSGLAAITIALLSCLKTGDEVLITDSAYEPVRSFADGHLRRMGISTRYYDPRIGGGIAELITERTRVIHVESPGSLTFELQDLPAIVAAAHARGVKVVVDNSWATPLYYKPLALGADIVIHAGTKMFVGHSDAFAGTISSTREAWPEIARTRRLLGFFTSGDEAFLTARGLRTLALRMREHSSRSRELARWLEGQAAVKAVYHPGLESHADHALYKRDFTGSGSLFSVLLHPRPRAKLAALVDDLRIFTMGYSWGGYESLFLPNNPARIRTAVPWLAEGNCVRVHVGFEGMDDLKADLSDGLARYLAP
jgi:cystathionine beta-lyase